MPVTPTHSIKQRLWVPWLVGGAVACAVMLGWNSLNQRERVDMERSTSIVLGLLETAITRDLDQRMSSLRRIADRWSYNGGTSRDAWEADVEHYLTDQPGYSAIEWVDASLQSQWVMRPEIEVSSQQRPSHFSLSTQELAVLLPEIDQPGLSRAIRLDAQHTGFLAYQPVERDGRADGFIVATFAFDAWLETLLNGSTDYLFNFQVWLEEDLAFDTSSFEMAPEDDQLKQSALTAHGRNWTIRVWLSGTRMAANQSRVADALLWAGLLVSVLLAMAVRTTLKSREESRDLLLHTRQLEAQWKNLPGMAYRSLPGNPSSIGFVSEGCLALTGYSKPDFLRARVSWGSMVHAEDRQGRSELIANAAAKEQSYQCEYRIEDCNGVEKWVWERGNFIVSHDDHLPVVEGLVLDVTDRKLTDLALNDATSYAETVVETAAEAIITISTQGKIESLNGSAETIFGYSKEELIGSNIDVLMPEPFKSEHDGYLQRYLNTGEKRIIGIGREVSGQRKDGTVFPLHLSVSEFATKDERKFVGLIRDLTEQQLAEQEASLHRERLAHVGRVNMLGEMATGIAHEINQPLSAISMYAQSGLRFLDAGVPRPERLRDALEKLSAQAHRAGAVIERMQQFARQRESRQETIDCNLLMQEVAYLAESEALIRDAQIRLELDHGIGTVVGDSIQLQQVALNLLRNGMESMASIDHRYGNHITLRTHGEEDGVRISIVDQGSGVSAEAAEQLYKPFASTKDMGMGIGLSICKSIIHSHGGQLDFVNTEGHGAAFFFTLPYTDRDNG